MVARSGASFTALAIPGIVTALRARVFDEVSHRRCPDHRNGGSASARGAARRPADLRRRIAARLHERRDLSDIIHGRDPRVIVVIGPCSIHDPAAALEYAGRLAEQIATYRDDLKIVMRVYFEKPRTTVGWKGLINDPHLNNSYDINLGLHTARSLLRSLIEQRRRLPAPSISTRSRRNTSATSSAGARSAHGPPKARSIANSRQGCRVRSDSRTARMGRCRSRWTRSSRRVIRTSFFPLQNKDIRRSSRRRGTRIATSSCAGAAASRTTTRSRCCAQRDALEGAGLMPTLMVDMSHANSGKQFRQQLDVAADISATARQAVSPASWAS